MTDRQIRLINEYKELKKKYYKLCEFIEKIENGEVDRKTIKCPISLLYVQQHLMRELCDTLFSRGYYDDVAENMLED